MLVIATYYVLLGERVVLPMSVMRPTGVGWGRYYLFQLRYLGVGGGVLSTSIMKPTRVGWGGTVYVSYDT